jgi:flagellar motor protein MotB
MKGLVICSLLSVWLLTGCTLVQRGAVLGSIFGTAPRATINATGNGIGSALGIDPATGVGVLTGPPTYEVYDTHRRMLKEAALPVDPETGEVHVSNKALAAYEKHLALTKANNLALIAQNERLIAASYTLADAIGADGRYVRVDTTPEGVLQITMVSEVLFESGSAQIKEAIYPVLDEVAAVISEEYPGSFIAIEGHTDAREVAETGYRSNWELSAARALSVLHYFADQKLIDATRMAVAGYSSNRPTADPSTPEGQRMNRRVVVTIMPANASVVPPM